MASRTRSLSQLVQTNLGRQIAGRLHRRSQAPVQTGRRVREGYGATRRSSLVWPGQPAPETPSEFPVEDDGLERLRRLRDALAQRQTDTAAPASQASPGRQAASRPAPPSSHSSQPTLSPRPAQLQSSAESAAASQRSSSERQAPSSDAPPRRRAIVEELTPASASTAATPNDPPVQRKGAATERRQSSRKTPPQQRGRHNNKAVTDSSLTDSTAVPAQLDTNRRQLDRAPVETHGADAEQPADVSDTRGITDVQPAPEQTTETPLRSDESAQRRPEPPSQEQTAPEKHQVGQHATPSQSPMLQVQRQRDTDTPPSVSNSSPSRTNELPAARHAELLTEQPSLTPTRPIETTRSDLKPGPPAPEQGKTQQGLTARAVSPANNEEATPTVDDPPGTRYHPTPPSTADPATEQRSDVAYHDQAAVQGTTAQGSGSQGGDHWVPKNPTGRAIDANLSVGLTSPEPSSRQDRARPDVSVTLTQHVQRGPEQTEQKSSTPADHEQHPPIHLDVDPTSSARESPVDQPPTRVDAQTLLALAADAQERSMPARQTRQQETKQPALQVQRQETAVRTARPGRSVTPPTVEEQPTVVQRAPAEDTAAARPEPTPESQPETPPTDDGADYDIDAMARDVYQILRRRLRVERERTRGWR